MIGKTLKYNSQLLYDFFSMFNRLFKFILFWALLVVFANEIQSKNWCFINIYIWYIYIFEIRKTKRQSYFVFLLQNLENYRTINPCYVIRTRSFHLLLFFCFHKLVRFLMKFWFMLHLQKLSIFLFSSLCALWLWTSPFWIKFFHSFCHL